MDRMKRLLSTTFGTGAADLRIVEVAFSGASIAVLVVGLLGVGRMADTSGEVLIGSLATCILALQLLVAGVVVPPALRERSR